MTTTYIYNVDNQLSEVRTDNTKQAEYTYRDSLTQSEENYLKSSQLYQTKLGNGQITTTYTNDGFGRLTKLLQSAGGLTKAFTYGYDNGDNRRSKRDALTRFDITSRSDGLTSGTFTYDELDRIITSSEGAETYTYDGKGNRLTLQSSIQMPHRDNIDYTYNQAEQLSGITRNQTSVSYKYNGDGLMTERSITKNGQATTTRYYYDGANIIAEGTVAADGSVTFKARYVRGAQLIYREDANNQKAYYQHNGHGDVTGLVKADGTALNSYTYDIWGNPLTADIQVENPFGYSGEFWDEDTGLQYLRSRWYDPSIGRFIQEDTFEGYVNRPSSLNPYTYVENNPLKYVDPNGHMPVWSLRLISSTYSNNHVDSGEASMMIFGGNLVLGDTRHTSLFTPFHEIAQINVAKQLREKYGKQAELEKKLSTGTKNIFGLNNKYEADVVLGKQVWEVKPLNGADPKPQLELYKKAGNLTEGVRLPTISGITVFGSIKMKIEFPEKGEALYSMYDTDKNGRVKKLTTVGAAYAIIRSLGKMTPGRRLSPGF